MTVKVTALDFARVKAVFLEVVERPEAERAQTLERLCGTDRALRAEVESLLDQEEPRTGDLLPTHPASLVPSASSGVRAEPDERIGPYRLGPPLGQGGMGVVYAATQEAPLRREVALKLIKPGMDSAGVIARFDAERQALALMDHPFIARVFDAGTAASGRPYFVMELVEGAPLAAFCAREKLGVRERLELFLRVCQAVQHAHQKGIIHRDIKPSNILVSRREGRPVPKVIDFGIAKAVAEPLGAGPWLTREGLPLGTLDYMSPEQAGVVPGGVDTRSDVYSLGVVLYELLVGHVPLVFGTSSPPEVHRVLGHETPTRPSLAAKASGEGAPYGATERGRRRLARELSGDLDNVVMKALHRERDRRYPSVEQLGEDVQRHLDSRPVRARPDSLGYRASRFVRRHRTGVGLASAAAVLLTVAGLGLVIQSWRLAREREAARVAESRATVEARTAQATADFLRRLFLTADPRARGDQTVTARDLLDAGLEEIDGDASLPPETRAQLHLTLGLAMSHLTEYERALPSLRAAVAEYEGLYGRDSVQTAEALHRLGDVLREARRYEEAQEALEEALAIRRRHLAPESEEMADSFNNLAILALARGDFAASERLQTESVAMHARLSGEGAPELGVPLNNLALLKRRLGKVDEALALARRAEVSLARTDDQSSITANRLLRARLARDLGSADEALAEFVALREVYLRLEGPDGITPINLQREIGQCQQVLGRYDEAEDAYSRTEVDLRRTGRLRSDSFAILRLHQGRLARERGDLAAGERMIEEAVDLHVDVQGPNHFRTAVLRSSLAEVLIDRGELARAETELRDGLSRLPAPEERPHADAGRILVLLARIDRLRGHPDAAWESLARARPVVLDTRGALSIAMGELLLEEALLRIAAGDRSAARPLLEEAASILEGRLPSTHPNRRRLARARGVG
jgi:serine/threonine protein kinase/tetratricopeptide (TPR) repeat protein